MVEGEEFYHFLLDYDSKVYRLSCLSWLLVQTVGNVLLYYSILASTNEQVSTN